MIIININFSNNYYCEKPDCTVVFEDLAKTGSVTLTNQTHENTSDQNWSTFLCKIFENHKLCDQVGM